MGMEEDLTWGGVHTIQYPLDVLQNSTPEAYVILLTNVTTINTIKIKKYFLKIKENKGKSLKFLEKKRISL